MKKENKIIIGILLAAIILFVVYQLYKYAEKKRAKKNDASDAAVNTSSGAVSGGLATTWGNDSFPLKNGSAGEKVKRVQTAINYAYKVIGSTTKLTVDGLFGSQTSGAVKYFQSLFGDTQTGIVTEADYNKYIVPFYNAYLTNKDNGTVHYSVWDIMTNV